MRIRQITTEISVWHIVEIKQVFVTWNDDCNILSALIKSPRKTVENHQSQRSDGSDLGLSSKGSGTSQSEINLGQWPAYSTFYSERERKQERKYLREMKQINAEDE